MADEIKLAPKFFFELDDRKYGARPLTIRQRAQVGAETERLTGGNLTKWLADPNMGITAFLLMAAVTMSASIVAWPADLPPIDFVNSDDAEVVTRHWEVFDRESKNFFKRTSNSSGVVGSELPA